MAKAIPDPDSSKESMNTGIDPEAQSKCGNAGKTSPEGSSTARLAWRRFWKCRVPLPVCVFLGILSLGLLVALMVVTTRPCSPHREFFPLCPHNWDHFQGQCYYFSEDEANWTTSLERCRALEASLAILRTEEELGFALRCESRRNYWIGLEQRDNGWWWIDGTAFDPGFEVRADNSCGVLNHLGIGPSFCRTQKSWICSRPDNSVLWKEGLGEP